MLTQPIRRWYHILLIYKAACTVILSLSLSFAVIVKLLQKKAREKAWERGYSYSVRGALIEILKTWRVCIVPAIAVVSMVSAGGLSPAVFLAMIEIS